MKKYFLLFAAGGFITLASCGGDTAPVQTVNIDSLAQVKVDSIAALEKAKSDSMVTAQAVLTADSLKAIMKADSIANAAAQSAGKNAPAKKVVGPKTKEVVKEGTAVSTAPQPDGRNGSIEQNTQGGLRSNADQNKQVGGLRSKADQNRQGDGLRSKADENKVK
jgi:hypothetical protein